MAAMINHRLRTRRLVRIYAVVLISLLLLQQLFIRVRRSDLPQSFGALFGLGRSTAAVPTAGGAAKVQAAARVGTRPAAQDAALVARLRAREMDLLERLQRREEELRRMESVVGDAEAEAARISKLIAAPDTILMHDALVRRTEGNATCTIVACFTKNTPGARHFYDYYKNSGYTVITTEMGNVTHNGGQVSPVWCRVPAVIKAQRENPAARVLYLDLDTRVSLRNWCNFKSLGPRAPIIMNSYYRGRPYIFRDFTLNGTRVQANAFIAAPGPVGLAAMKRWEQAFWTGQYRDQGAVHLQEDGLCGVPGWVHCYSNPEQQRCHCTGVLVPAEKDECVRKLYAGQKSGCKITYY